MSRFFVAVTILLLALDTLAASPTSVSWEVDEGRGDVAVTTQEIAFHTFYSTQTGRIQKTNAGGDILATWDVPSLVRGGIAPVGPNQVFVANGAFGRERVFLFSGSGETLDSWDFRDIGNPEGVAVDGAGRAYVLTSFYGTEEPGCAWGVQVIETSGELGRSFCLGYDATNRRALEGRRIAIDDARGWIWIGETGQHLHKYTLEGTLLQSFGGRGNTNYGRVTGLDTSTDGHVVVSRSGVGAPDVVEILDHDGKLLASWEVSSAQDLAVVADEVWVRANGQIRKFEITPDLTPTRTVETRFALSSPARVGSTGATFRFTLPRATHAKLGVYDVHGRLVNELLDEPRGAGEHAVSWGALNGRGAPVASGVYFLRLEAQSSIHNQKFVLVR